MNQKLKLEHQQLLCEPVKEKDRARMEGIYDTISRTAGEAHDALASMVALEEGGAPRMVLPGVYLLPNVPKFKGVAICTHCVTRAAMLLRDLANTCDDMVKEAEKHGKPIPRRK